MFESYTTDIFPREPIAPPNDRHGQTEVKLQLPPGTTVFSADNHIEIADDIWYENFPAHLKDKAPRISQSKTGVTRIEVGGQSLLPDSFSVVFEAYGLVPGYNSNAMLARMKDLDDDGVDKELAFPNASLAMLLFPDKDIRERCFRIYNEHLAKLQAQCPGRFYGVGLINWWDAEGARRTIAELKSLGLKTFMLPLNPGTDADGAKIDYASTKMTPVWEAIEESGLPVSHHIGENLPQSCEFNTISINYVHACTPFRDLFCRYSFGGILDRHPGLRVGWFEGGINWIVSTLQDAEHARANFWHMDNLKLKHEPEYYWKNHMCASFMVDPLGLEMIDRIGVENIMWASDYPHIEGIFGYSKSSINHVAKVIGPERAVAVVGGNVARFLKL